MAANLGLVALGLGLEGLGCTKTDYGTGSVTPWISYRNPALHMRKYP